MRPTEPVLLTRVMVKRARGPPVLKCTLFVEDSGSRSLRSSSGLSMSGSSVIEACDIAVHARMVTNSAVLSSLVAKDRKIDHRLRVSSNASRSKDGLLEL